MAEKSKKTRMFAAIDVGSYEMSLKIFEISPKNGIKRVDSLKHRIALGNDSYFTRRISLKKMEEVFRILEEFRSVCRSYKVTAYKAYGTSALRETENTSMILGQIKSRTGIDVEVLSNSEQRFLDYKAIAAKGRMFDKVIEKGTAIIDIGGGSIQLSLFDKDSLVITQSLKLGVLRLNERIAEIRPRSTQLEDLLDEMIGGQLHTFHKMFLKEREIPNLIIMDEYLSPRFNKALPDSKDDTASAESFLAFADGLLKKRDEETADLLEMPEENVGLLKMSVAVIKRVIRDFKAESVWAPGAELCDGIAYEYAEAKHLTKIAHDFEADILQGAAMISRRYQGSGRHAAAVEKAGIAIFDGMKSLHGMGPREKLLLRLASTLQDCGKYINMMNVGVCSYSIIENTEIIGISHRERMMVASIVKYIHEPFEYYREMTEHVDIDKESYLKIAKLTAILQLANALDKGKKEKIKKISATLVDGELKINIDSRQDFLFEQERFKNKALFFEEIYGIRPVIVRT